MAHLHVLVCVSQGGGGGGMCRGESNNENIANKLYL